MIKKLSIHNYALIDKLNIDLFKGLNIITGETGAGKSILLGSLELVMGGRADYSVLLDKDKKCIVEVTYDINDYQLKEYFLENDLEYNDELIVRRVISPTGKSRAFVNDEPVNLSVLKELSSFLIQMHRQFDNLDLNKSAYQLKLIDVFGENYRLLEKYRDLYKTYRQEQQSLKKLLEENESFKKEMQFLEFQFNELNDVNISKIDFENAENEFNNLNNAESSKTSLQNTYDVLVEGEFSILNRMDEVLVEINNVDLKNDEFDKSKEKFYDAIENLRDVANEFFNIAEKTDYDEKRIIELKDYLDTINNLMNKHKVESIDKLIEIRNDLENKLQRHFDVDAEIKKLKKQIADREIKLNKHAEKLSLNRQISAKKFSTNVQNILKELALPHSQLKVMIEELEDLNDSGKDKVYFLFNANKGGEFKPLKDVVSGGELSRLALSIESNIADKMALPTMIFDEIEAGISGEVARKMGVILKNMSCKHQLINITHSPQIASNADYHYFVYKKIIDNATKTNIRLLSEEERIIELAKMLSGDPPTLGALENAKELINKN